MGFWDKIKDKLGQGYDTASSGVKSGANYIKGRLSKKELSPIEEMALDWGEVTDTLNNAAALTEKRGDRGDLLENAYTLLGEMKEKYSIDPPKELDEEQMGKYEALVQYQVTLYHKVHEVKRINNPAQVEALVTGMNETLAELELIAEEGEEKEATSEKVKKHMKKHWGKYAAGVSVAILRALIRR